MKSRRKLPEFTVMLSILKRNRYNSYVKMNKRSLPQSDNPFEIIFLQSPISTQIFSSDGTTLMVNKAWEKLWKIKARDIIGTYNILKDKQLVEKGILPILKRAFNGVVVETPEIKYEPDRTVPGLSQIEYTWTKAIAYPIKNAAGKVTKVVLQHEDVTERRDAEERLKKSERRLKAVWNNIDDGLVISDENGTVLAVNPAYCQLYGYSEKELVGKKFSAIFKPGDRKVADEAYNRIFRAKKDGVIPESTVISKNGEEKIVESVYSYIEEENKKVAMLSIIRDITDLKKTELNQLRLASIVTSSDDAIISKNLDGIITSWNKSAERMFGWKAEEAIGKHITIIIPPELRDEETMIISKIKRGQIVDHVETVRMGKSGNRFDISLTISPMRNSKGKIIGASKIARDISDKKRSERALLENERRLRIAIDAGQIGVWDWDIVHNSIVWSDKVYEIYDTKRNEFDVTYENFRKHILPEDIKIAETAIRDAVAGTKDFEVTYRIMTLKGTTKWISSRAIVLRDDSGKPVRMLGATLDTTLQKKTEQEKSDFLSMASHELKTPLTSMKMFIELLQKQIEELDLEKPGYFITRIHDQANRLSELTNDLLDVSRIETGKLRLNKKKFKLEKLITETVEGIQPSSPEHPIVVDDIEDVTILADRYRLYQVLVNLLTNAVKYSPAGKKIIVTGRKDGSHIIVSVKDFGIGIPKNQQERIFERLYQVSEPKEKTYPGLGLGLFISREIIERHKGELWVESVKGKGSTFIFKLPYQKQHAE